MRFFWITTPLLALLLSACSSGGSSSTGASAGTGGGGGSASSSTGTGGTGTGGSGACGSGMSTCSDQTILALNLQMTPTMALITNTADGAGWTSNIDATAGGPFTSTPDSYTYGKFTDQGLQKVDIGDQDALSSSAWDVAFRRYVARVNSGASGPSCVKAAVVPGKPTYDSVTALPGGLTYKGDDYMDKNCALIADSSGLPDSPATALDGYWTYNGCVQMTKEVFIIALADGKHVKFTIDDYYSPTVQDQCDTTGMIPMSNTGSANFVVRWAFVQ
jgi:hypothetical protein